MRTSTTERLEALPEFAIELKSVALNPADRRWVRLMRGKYAQYRFPNWDAAEVFMNELKRTQPHLDLRVVPFEGWS